MERIASRRSLLFTIVLICIAAVVGTWAYLTGAALPDDTPPLTPWSVLILIAVGTMAGILGGLIGTGGCSIMLPILHFWLGYPAPVAIGTTLFAVIFTATSGGHGHLIRGNIDRSAAMWLGGFGLIGILIGSWLFTILASQVALLGLILGMAFILPALRMIWEGSRPAEQPQKVGEMIQGSRYRMGVFGIIIGVLTGIVGLGGGYALVPGLIYLFGAPVYLTMGTSLLTMIPLALVGGTIKLAQGFVALVAAVTMGAGSTVGARFAASIIRRFKPTQLKLLFGIYFLYVSLKFILGYFGIMIW
ncbi:MAG: sulfite exporter TauE/SafE family protein [Candidatus Thorarchaeota archaeon]